MPILCGTVHLHIAILIFFVIHSVGPYLEHLVHFSTSLPYLQAGQQVNTVETEPPTYPKGQSQSCNPKTAWGSVQIAHCLSSHIPTLCDTVHLQNSILSFTTMQSELTFYKLQFLTYKFLSKFAI